MGVARRLGLIVVLGLVAAACSHPYTGKARGVAPTSITAEAGWLVVPTPVVRQAGATDCGPASLAMVAGRWQVALTRDQITSALPPNRGRGARLGALRDVARASGLRAFAIVADREVLAHELQLGRPVLIGLVRPHGRRSRSHFEVVVGLHPDGRVATIDPAEGWQVRTWEALEAEWTPAGRAALVVVGTHTASASARP